MSWKVLLFALFAAGSVFASALPAPVFCGVPDAGLDEDMDGPQSGGSVPDARPLMAEQSGRFIENKGQWAPSALRLSGEAGGLRIGFFDDGVRLVDQGASWTLAVSFPGSNRAEPTGEEPGATPLTYLRAGAAGPSMLGAQSFAKVRYAGLYDGMDLVYRSSASNVKYDLELEPGSDLGTFRMAFNGATGLWLDSAGALVVDYPGGQLHDEAPWAVDAAGRHVECAYQLVEPFAVGMACPEWSGDLPLTVDPVMYATYFGGQGSAEPFALDVDAQGNAYAVGYASSYGTFPTTAGALDTSIGGNADAFLVKMNPTGTSLLYASFIGGSADEYAYSVDVGPDGGVFIGGSTRSSDFPFTSGAYSDQVNTSGGSGFLLKLNASGSSLDFATATDQEGGYIDALVVDGAGQAIINVPARYSFPGTGSSERYVPFGEGDSVIAKFEADGSGVVWSTFLGGGFVRDFVLDAAENVYGVGGVRGVPFNATPGAFQTAAGGGSSDVTVFKLNASGNHFEYSSLLGGGANESGGAVAVTAQGELVAVGWTESGDFPVTSGAYDTTPNGDEYPPGSGAFYRDVFVARFSANGSSVVKGTLLGGNGWDQAYGVSLSANGSVIIAGLTHGNGFPLTTEAPEPFQYRNYTYVARFDANLSNLEFSMALNGTAGQVSSDVPLGSDGSAFVTGVPEYQGGFQPTQGVYQSTAGPCFLVRLTLSGDSTQTPPTTANLTISTSPAHIALIIDGHENSSTLYRWEVGSTHTLEAPSTAMLVDAYYEFLEWSDGGARVRNITVSADASLQANFTEIVEETFVLFFAPAPGRPRAQPQVEVEVGETQTFVVEVANLNNYTGPAISITVPSPPQGVSVDCNPVTISPPQNSTCTVHATSQAAAGNFTVKVVATNGTFVQEMSVPIKVAPQPPREPPQATPNDLYLPVVLVVASALVLFGLLRFAARRGRR